MLGHPVGVQELAGNIHDLVAPPVHHKTGFGSHFCHNGSFQIFFIREFGEFFPVFFPDDHRHTFLGFGNSQLRTVQAGVFFRHLIQVDLQTLRQLANGYGYTAGAKVVAAFDQHRHFRITEQALNFPFRRRIALLYLRPAVCQGIHCMFL